MPDSQLSPTFNNAPVSVVNQQGHAGSTVQGRIPTLSIAASSGGLVQTSPTQSSGSVNLGAAAASSVSSTTGGGGRSNLPQPHPAAIFMTSQGRTSALTMTKGSVLSVPSMMVQSGQTTPSQISSNSNPRVQQPFSPTSPLASPISGGQQNFTPSQT